MSKNHISGRWRLYIIHAYIINILERITWAIFTAPVGIQLLSFYVGCLQLFAKGDQIYGYFGAPWVIHGEITPYGIMKCGNLFLVLIVSLPITKIKYPLKKKVCRNVKSKCRNLHRRGFTSHL